MHTATHTHLQAVPAYIQKVNWGSLIETLEVYSLLEEISDTKDSFPVEVSLSELTVHHAMAAHTYHCGLW